MVYYNLKTAKDNVGGGIVVSEDYNKVDVGKKMFKIFKSYKSLLETLKSKDINHYYEIFQTGNPWNFIVDLDLKKDEDPEAFDNPKDRVSWCIETFWDSISKYAGFLIPEYKTIVLESPPTEIKKSYHIIFRMDNIYFKDHLVCKDFAKKYFNKKLDEAIYSASRSFRTIYSSKITQPDKILRINKELSDDDIEEIDSFGSYCPVDINTKFICKPRIKKGKKIVNEFNNTLESDRKDTEELIRGLSKERYEVYNKWINVGFILKGLSKDYIDIFHEFSKQSDKYSEKDCEDKWDSLDEDKCKENTIRDLINLYNYDNPDKTYKDILKEIDFDLECRDDILSKFIHKYYSTDFLCSDIESNEFYSFNGNTWELEDSNYFMRNKIITEIICLFEKRRDFWKSKLKEGGSQDEMAIAECYSESNNAICKKLGSGIRLVCLELFFKDFKFNKIKNSNPNLLAFDNGVYELDTKTFRQGNHKDYITLTTQNEYQDNLDTKDIVKYLKDIFPDPEMFKYMMLVFTSILFGRNREEAFYIFTGTGANGKGVIQDLLKHGLGEYFKTGKTALLTNKREDSGGANSSMMNLRDCRCAMFPETESTDFLNVGLIKQLSGNDQVSARQLYKKEETFNISFKMFLSVNQDLPKIHSIDGGFIRRLRICPFETEFKKSEDYDASNPIHKPMDNTLKEKLPELGIQFIHYLIKTWLPIYNTDGIKNTPDKVNVITQNYLDNNNEIKLFIDEKLEKGGFLLKSELKGLYKSSDMKSMKWNQFVEKFEAQIGKKFQPSMNINKVRYKYVIQGYKDKSEEIEEED